MSEMINVVEKPRRRSAKATKGRESSRKKLSVYVSLEAWQKLGITATMTQKSQSDLVDSMILAQLRRFRVQDLGGRSALPETEDVSVAGEAQA